jgi:hypothetical protein
MTALSSTSSRRRAHTGPDVGFPLPFTCAWSLLRIKPTDARVGLCNAISQFPPSAPPLGSAPSLQRRRPLEHHGCHGDGHTHTWAPNFNLPYIYYSRRDWTDAWLRDHSQFWTKLPISFGRGQLAWHENTSRSQLPKTGTWGVFTSRKVAESYCSIFRCYLAKFVQLWTN